MPTRPCRSSAQDDVAFGFLTTTVIVGDADAKVGRREAAGHRAHHQRARLRHHPRDLERGRGLARQPARQPLRQCAPAHRAHPQSRTHDAGLGGVGGTAGKPSPAGAAADDDGNARQHAVPSRSARRRRRAHAGASGPTGAGKSVLLALLALQFRRFIGAQVVLFDRGRSARAATLAMGGESIELGLARDALPAAAGAHRRARRNRLCPAMGHGAARRRRRARHPRRQRCRVDGAARASPRAPRAERTLTGLAVLIQSNALVAALSPYTWKAPTAACWMAPPRRIGTNRRAALSKWKS